MRPRMYGSSDRKWFRTSTWPSASAGTSVSTRRKLSAVASPCGRDARTICLLMVMMFPLSVGGIEPLELTPAGRQRLQVLERARGVRHERAVVGHDGAFAEREA